MTGRLDSEYMKRQQIKLVIWFFIAAAIGTIVAPLVQVTVSAAISKGGVGIIKANLFVLTNTKENTVLRGDGGRYTWTGHDAAQPETILASETGVISFSWSSLKHTGSYPVLIRFTPHNIYFYDLRKCTGGRYKRHYGEKT